MFLSLRYIVSLLLNSSFSCEFLTLRSCYKGEKDAYRRVMQILVYVHETEGFKPCPMPVF